MKNDTDNKATIQIRLCELIDDVEHHDFDPETDLHPFKNELWRVMNASEPYSTVDNHGLAEHLAKVIGIHKADSDLYLEVRYGNDYEPEDSDTVHINAASMCSRDVDFPTLENAVYVSEQVNKFGKDAVPHRIAVNAGHIFARQSNALWTYIVKELEKTGALKTAVALAKAEQETDT